MGDRKQYNTCMKPYITGSKPKEERKMSFCIGAKICSGKAQNEAEAREICSQPKPPRPAKEGKKRGKKVIPCEVEVSDIVSCMGGIVSYPLPKNRNELNENLFNALMECKCQK